MLSFQILIYKWQGFFKYFNMGCKMIRKVFEKVNFGGYEDDLRGKEWRL